MKKVKVIILSVMMSSLLAGCKTDSPANNQNIQPAPSTIASIPTESGTEVKEGNLPLLQGFENWEETDAIEALNHVVTMEAPVKEVATQEGRTGVEDFKQYYLNELNHFLDYSFDQNMVPDQYAVVDMDHDGTPEVIVRLTANNNDWIMLLRYYDGNVYGYSYVVRGFENPKADGTYVASSGASDNKIIKLSFDGYDLQENLLANSISVNDSVEYYIADNRVSENEYMEFCNKHYSSEDVRWYLIPSNTRAGYIGKELFHVDFSAITEPMGKELESYYSEIEEESKFSHSSRIPQELYDLITEAMASGKEEETISPLVGTEISQEEFCSETGFIPELMESVLAVKVDADNDGIQDLIGQYYWGGTGGFSSMELYQGNDEGQYRLANSFDCLLQDFNFITYQGKNYLLMKEFDYNTKYYSGYSLYLYEEGMLADGMVFSFAIEDYESTIVREDSSFGGIDQIKKTLIDKRLPDILNNNDGVIVGNAETVDDSNGDYQYTGDINNDGTPEYYNKHMWYPSNLGTVMECIYDFKDSNVLGDLCARLADEIGEGRLYTFWIDKVEDRNVVYLYYGRNMDYSLYAYLLEGAR